MKAAFWATLLITVSGGPVQAQDPVGRAIARFDQQMVSIMERALTQHTEKTTSIIYLRRVAGGATTGRYCGEALFGSSRDRFIVDMTENSVVRAPSTQVWREASCEAQLPEGHTLIDLR